MTDAADALAEYVKANLPLAGAMGVTIACASDAAVTLHVPLPPNLNHERTAFGGSISACGMLAGWGLIWLQMRHIEPRPRLVIAESQTRFIRPIDGNFEAVCAWPRPDSWQIAADALARHRRAKVPLRSELRVNGKTAAVHDGTFVVIATG